MFKLILLLTTVAMAASQSAPDVLKHCPADLPIQYLATINHITESTLSQFSLHHPDMEPLTLPLTFGLTVQPPIGTPSSVQTLQPIVNRHSLGMKIFANTLEEMITSWYTALANTSAPLFTKITALNDITRTTMGALGRKYAGLKPLTDPLPLALAFNAYNGLGRSVFNYGIEPKVVGYNLQMFSRNLTAMADEWTKLTSFFLEREVQCSTGSPSGSTTTTTLAPVIIRTTTTPIPTTLAPPTPACPDDFVTSYNQMLSINGHTRQTLTTFGRSKPRLMALANSLIYGLSFNAYNQRGMGNFNMNQDVVTTAAEMRQFAEQLLKMANQWEILANSC